MAGRETVSVNGLQCTTGRLQGRPVVVAVTGVGKVNAAMSTTLVLERFSPSTVVFTGVAGALGPDLEPGDVVVAERLVQHDLVNHGEDGTVARTVRSPLSGEENPVAIEASAPLLALARGATATVRLEPVAGASRPRRPRVVFGTIATGDSFIGSEAKKAALRDGVGAIAVEMEGAAVAQVCHQLRVPFLVVRGLSDGAGRGAREEARRNLPVAADNAARLALAVARGIGTAD